MKEKSQKALAAVRLAIVKANEAQATADRCRDAVNKALEDLHAAQEVYAKASDADRLAGSRYNKAVDNVLVAREFLALAIEQDEPETLSE